MTTSEILDELRSRILSHDTLLFLTTWEEQRWQDELSTLAMEMERGLVIWSATEGPLPSPSDTAVNETTPLQFLEQITSYPPDHLFLLKDFHPFLDDPYVIRKLRDLVSPLAAENKTLLFLGPDGQIPLELRKDAVTIDLPLPRLEDLRDELATVLQGQGDGQPSELQITSDQITSDQEERLLKAVLGLTAREARKALMRALLGRNKIDDDVYASLVSEKKHLIQGSDLLEFHDFEEHVADVGGLGALKQWITQRAEAYSSRAVELGIPMPKGVLLLGVQGCGKSLTARVAARLLGFPLVRLDVSSLLSSDLGSSEQNMRDVLQLVEAIAPAVLWLDELEKGFAGFDREVAQDPTMSRIAGRFVTWMQERRSPVFVVATANSVTELPPEFLRRGRFDELFFLDLPNYDERKQILSIHLSKRSWNPQKFDLEQLATQTDGFSGAELEQIVKSAMIEAFGKGQILSDADLKFAREQTVPLSVTMEEKIFELREWAKTRCRPATPDSRVLQMLEEEHRRGELFQEEKDDRPSAVKQEWGTLAEHGQLSAALVEFVRHSDHVTFPQLQKTFEEYLQADGQQGLALRSDPHVVLWLGMGQQLAEMLSKLITSKRIYLHPVDVDLYKKSGHNVKLPLLEQLPEDRLGKACWFPMCLRVLPLPGASSRFARVSRIKLK